MSGRVVNLFLKAAHGQPMQAVDTVEAVSGQGLLGDASFGRGTRQVLVIEREALSNFDLTPGHVRENVTIAGLALAGLPPGTQIQAGEVLMEVTGDCAPCGFLDGIRDGLQSDMAGQRGTLCRVLLGGVMRVADDILVVSPEQA